MSGEKFRNRFVEIWSKGKTGGTVSSNEKEATTAAGFSKSSKDGKEQEENRDSQCPTTASRKRGQSPSPSQQKSQSPPIPAKAKKPNPDEKETDAAFIHDVAEKYELTGNSLVALDRIN